MTCVIVEQHLMLKDTVNEFVGDKDVVVVGGGRDICLAQPSSLVEEAETDHNQKPSSVPFL